MNDLDFSDAKLSNIGNTREQLTKAARQCCGNASDAAEARLFMEALGLLPYQPVVRTRESVVRR